MVLESGLRFFEYLDPSEGGNSCLGPQRGSGTQAQKFRYLDI